ATLGFRHGGERTHANSNRVVARAAQATDVSDGTYGCPEGSTLVMQRADGGGELALRTTRFRESGKAWRYQSTQLPAGASHLHPPLPARRGGERAGFSRHTERS